MRRTSIGPALATVSLAASMSVASPAWADQTLVFDGEVPAAGPDHFFIPFEVPAGTKEIEVRHDDMSEANILDWGLDDASGYRGWGGGTTEPALVGEQAASRAYVRGPVAPGQWRVVVGKAKVVASPARYHVEVDLRNAPTLPPSVGKVAYVPAGVRKAERRYYAGDFHAHSRESTDATPAPLAMMQFAKSRGLDFVEISDHNTVTQLDDFAELHKAVPDFLVLPGIEFTTYAGHANAIGATKWVDHRIGQPGVTIDQAFANVQAQGALFAINHPTLDLGTACIGCSWKQPLAHGSVQAMEISTGGVAVLFPAAIKMWDSYLNEGHHVAPIGGSDDHSGGQSVSGFTGNIGAPTTLVLSNELSEAAIIDGVRKGRTVVKMTGPQDPMIELSTTSGVVGDTVSGRSLRFRAKVTGSERGEFTIRFVRNGEVLDEVSVDSSAKPFVYEQLFDAPQTGEDHIRAEVVQGPILKTVTGHIWFKRDPNGPDERATESSGCQAGSKGAQAAPLSMASGSGGPMALVWTALGALAFAWKRRRTTRT